MVTEAGPGWTAADLRPFVAVAVEEFGPRRLMFGSDWPVCLLVADYRAVRRALDDALAPLAAPDLAEIFAGTAMRTYGLTGTRIRARAGAAPA